MSEKKNGAKTEELSPETWAAVQAKGFSGRKTFLECRRLLFELARFDDHTDQLMAGAQKWGCAGGVGAALAFFGLLFTFQTEDPRLIGGVGLVVLIFAAFGIFNYFKFRKYKKVDLLNDFKTLLIPLLDEMTEDVPADGKVQMKLDLKDLVPEKVLSKGELPPGRFKKVTKTIYRDPWCEAAVELADGNELRLKVENFVDEEERRWTNPRGKSKSKTKWRKTVVVSAQLFPQSSLEWEEAKAESVGGPGQKVKFVEKGEVKCCRLIRKYKYKTVNEKPADVPPAPEIFGMFLQLYSLLHPTGQRS